MWYPIFQITFFISISSFIRVRAVDTVSACVPDTYNNDTSGICRDVFYYLSNTNYASCDQVCGVHGMNCTAVNHGFNNTTVLKIFATILGHTCSFKKQYSPYTRNGPAYHDQIAEPYCSKWENIPEMINCESSPLHKRMFRLCPCVDESSPTSNSDQFPAPTATNQAPDPTANDPATNQAPDSTTMCKDPMTGPGHSAACRQSNKDLFLIFFFIFLVFFQFY